MESVKKGKCVLEKSLNFLFKKGDEPWKSASDRRGAGTARNASPLVRCAHAFVFSLPLLVCSPEKNCKLRSLNPVIRVQIVGISQRDVSGKNS